MKEREEGNEKLAKELANLEQQLRDREGERAQAERVVDSLREELKRIQVELRSTREKLGLAEDGMESLKARISEKQQEVRMICPGPHLIEVDIMTTCQCAVKVKRHNVVRGGPLSWIPGMRFTRCKFHL